MELLKNVKNITSCF